MRWLAVSGQQTKKRVVLPPSPMEQRFESDNSISLYRKRHHINGPANQYAAHSQFSSKHNVVTWAWGAHVASIWPNRILIWHSIFAGVTTMLNFFTTSNGFRSTLPVVSNLTAMNVWDGVCMCFIYASLLEFVCVNYVGRKRPLHNVVYRPGENPVTQVMSMKRKQCDKITFGPWFSLNFLLFSLLIYIYICISISTLTKYDLSSLATLFNLHYRFFVPIFISLSTIKQQNISFSSWIHALNSFVGYISIAGHLHRCAHRR